MRNSCDVRDRPPRGPWYQLVPIVLVALLVALASARGAGAAPQTARPGARAAAVGDGVRPVVLVHGLNSTAAIWGAYTQPGGFLARIGRRGFAVGDGQAPGVMDTGDFANPSAPTRTIAENAAALRDYIAGVKRLTGADQVDLVAHSMGGLIARYYLDRLMDGRDVGSLIMLGTPNGGSDCASLPAALGFYAPATLELRPEYVQGIFNRQITHRRGVPFHLVAGTPFVDAVRSPCAATPSDIVVSLASATGVATPVAEVPVEHTTLPQSAETFDTFVAPLLLADAGTLPFAPDPDPAPVTGGPLQFARVFAGHVAAGGSAEQTIALDAVSVASFALFDPSRSLRVVVRGAGGAEIPLDATATGLVTVDDPAALLHLGYGFRDPRPGPWRVTLQATAATPPGGADYAIAAQLQGGATLRGATSAILPRVGETIDLTARLDLGGQPLAIEEATATIHRPDGRAETIRLSTGTAARARWQPAIAGAHGIDLAVAGHAPDGTRIERVAFLALEAQPRAAQVWANRLVLALGVLAIPVGLVVGGRRLLRRRAARRSAGRVIA